MTDHVDRILEQWDTERPDLDVSSMAVVGRLSRLSVIVGNELRRAFARHDLDPSSFDVLGTLRRSGPDPLTPARLMRASMVTSGAISQRLDRLEARGLVARRPCASDGRVVEVWLTPRGRALVDRALPDHVATMERLLAGLTAEEREQLASLLRSALTSLGDTLDGS